jgi:hypothetical protein
MESFDRDDFAPCLEVDRGIMPVVRSNPNQTSYIRKLLAYSPTLTLKTFFMSTMGLSVSKYSRLQRAASGSVP